MTGGNRKRKVHNWVVLLPLLLITVLLVSGCNLRQDQDDAVLVPDYAPEGSEPNAATIPSDTGSSENSANGGGSVWLLYSNQVTIDLSEGTASLYFANPKRSNQDMILQIVIQDEVVVQSGVIPAGYEVKTLSLLSGVAQKLREGGYNAKFVIYYYNQETGEKATVNTEIPIRITVVK